MRRPLLLVLFVVLVGIFAASLFVPSRPAGLEVTDVSISPEAASEWQGNVLWVAKSSSTDPM